jgi:hypothetical protein
MFKNWLWLVLCLLVTTVTCQEFDDYEKELLDIVTTTRNEELKEPTATTKCNGYDFDGKIQLLFVVVCVCV